VAVVAKHVGRPPDILTLKEAGAVATAGLTALQGIDDVLKIKRGEAVVIHGASGGVGSLALQFAKMRGARVLATSSGEDGIRFVRRLGAVPLLMDVMTTSRRLRAASPPTASMRCWHVLGVRAPRTSHRGVEDQRTDRSVVSP
jgi:NADPH:quinone reductase-like Zn-dependent oxidoreductase